MPFGIESKQFKIHALSISLLQSVLALKPATDSVALASESASVL
ncbi:hypothetical protein COO91_10894 (plasmid) [Nostoc flagelliforme CCNUN1]|uniref:Uncharacterized protein n=1 Tax=Nostoc flagelliforme CCNUN1 TaxID=2038116 RepID=A0A2K8TAE7_9NOSO|nr:hypothetical protein COO91_10894 [Nostoc flagelliforme CCNUN1]